MEFNFIQSNGVWLVLGMFITITKHPSPTSKLGVYHSWPVMQFTYMAN